MGSTLSNLALSIVFGCTVDLNRMFQLLCENLVDYATKWSLTKLKLNLHLKNSFFLPSACDCDEFGSVDNFCNIRTGQCTCRIKADGRQCNLCPTSHWGFPTCQPCLCNNHSPNCDPKTGVCKECQHDTTGDNCENCKEGFYGDATQGM